MERFRHLTRRIFFDKNSTMKWEREVSFRALDLAETQILKTQRFPKRNGDEILSWTLATYHKYETHSTVGELFLKPPQ